MSGAISILYVVTELDVGGAEKMLYELAVRARSAGHGVNVVCLYGKGDVARWLEREGIRAESLGMAGRMDVRVLPRLVRVIRRVKPDVLHSFLFHANVAGRLAGRMAGVPVVIGSVRVEEPRRHHLLFDRLTAWATDAETCVSESVADYTERRAGIARSKLVVIRNGVVAAEADAGARKKARAVLGLDGGWPVVGSIGRLDRQKGMDVLLSAFQEVLEKVPDARLVVAGGGPDRKALELAAARAGISARVRFLGFRAGAAKLAACFDVFVLASRWEGLPNVLLEAMAAGCPAVATAVGGVPELIKNGRTGILVPPDDAAALAKAVTGLLQDEESAAQMGQEARRWVVERFGMERMWEKTAALYEELLARKGVRPGEAA